MIIMPTRKTTSKSKTKAEPKKTSAKKTTTSKAASTKKMTASKTSTAKAATKKTAVKKSTTKKTSVASKKNTTAKAANKTPAKKSTPKTSSTTTKKTAAPTKKTIAPKKTKKKIIPLDLPDHAKDLSEEKLLEMPESMYMDQLQLDFFKLRLEEMRESIIEEIQAAKERLKTPTGSGDEVDMASQVESQQIDIRIIERKTKLLANIEKAILRIDDNEYGYCTETGEPIGIPRLLVRPTAVLCITSKEVHEAKEKVEEL